MHKDIEKYILPNIPQDVSTVYGVPRSGILPASIIATAIGADLGVAGSKDLFSGHRKKNFLNKKQGNRILLVDDSINTGQSLLGYRQMMDVPCLTCGIYTVPETRHLVDIAGPVCPRPRMFQWNFSGHATTNLSYFDMDGVICEDPTAFDDDGIGYQNDIATLKPLYIPQTGIKAICTNRLEKWRGITEDWLRRHNVQYEKLIMRQFNTAAERRKHGNPGLYKAQQYMNDPSAMLFVESHDAQAKVIAEKSKKPCLSIETMRMFN